MPDKCSGSDLQDLLSNIVAQRQPAVVKSALGYMEWLRF